MVIADGSLPSSFSKHLHKFFWILYKNRFCRSVLQYSMYLGCPGRYFFMIIINLKLGLITIISLLSFPSTFLSHAIVKLSEPASGFKFLIAINSIGFQTIRIPRSSLQLIFTEASEISPAKIVLAKVGCATFKLLVFDLMNLSLLGLLLAFPLANMGAILFGIIARLFFDFSDFPDSRDFSSPSSVRIWSCLIATTFSRLNNLPNI